MDTEFTVIAAQTCGAIAAGILGIALLVLWRADPKDHAPLHWGVASVANALRQVALLYGLGQQASPAELVGYFADAMAVFALGGFVSGAILYLQRNIRWSCAALAGCAVYLAFALPRYLGASQYWHGTTYGILVTLTGVVMGIAFFNAWRHDRHPGHATLTCLMLLLIVVSIALVANIDNAPAFAWLTFVRVALILGITITLILLVQTRLVDRLRTTQSRLSGFLASSSDWVWEVDENLTITYISANISNIVDVRPEAYIGRTRDDIYEHLGPNPEWRQLKAVMVERQPFRDWRIRHMVRHTGKPVVHALSGDPVYSPSGTYLGYRGIGRNVTREVETEAVLDAISGGIADRIGEDYMRSLVVHLARSLGLDVVYVGAIDDTGRFVNTLAIWRNGHIAGSGGYDLATTACGEVVRRRQVVCPAGAAAQYPNDPLLQEERIESYLGTVLTNSDGAAIGVLELMSRRANSGLGVAQTVATAIAPRAAAELERLIAERRVREGELRFRTVLDNMPVAVFLTVGERITVANRTFADAVGLPCSEVEQLTLRELYRHTGWPAETLLVSLELEDLVRRTGKVETLERRFINADGQSRDILSAKFPVFDAAGHIAAIGTVSTDITDQQRMAASLLQAQKMETLGLLAGGIAHDFNNIVGAIVGFAGFIAEDSEPESSNRRYAERIQTACIRARDIIKQILAYSRRSEAIRRHIPIAALLDEAAGLAAASLPATTRLEVGIVPEGAATAGDEAQLIQVLTNLIVNASDALGAAGGEVRIDTASLPGAATAAEIAQATEIVERPDGTLRYVVGRIDTARTHVRIAVRDAGEGMDREILKRLFEPFFTTKPRGRGTGLGLPLVQGIVVAHGGAIAVTTRVGAGTSFNLYLPAAGDAEPPAAALPPAGNAHRGRIMVIDDDDDFGDMLAAALERTGYETAVVGDPGAAIAAFDADPFAWDLIVTDYDMPGRSGAEVIAHVRSRRPDIAVVLCSGAGQPGMESLARAAGAAAFLAKPVDVAVLAQVAARLIVPDNASRPLTAV